MAKVHVGQTEQFSDDGDGDVSDLTSGWYKIDLAHASNETCSIEIIISYSLTSVFIEVWDQQLEQLYRPMYLVYVCDKPDNGHDMLS